MEFATILKKIIVFITFFSVLIIFNSCRTPDPAPSCNQFCKYRIHITDGENYSNEKGFGEFNKNGSPSICNYFGQNWPSFEVYLVNPKTKLCTNNNRSLNLNGITDWFQGDKCITKSEAKQYAQSKVEFMLENLKNEYFSVRAKPGMCPDRCVLYKISGLKGDIRYRVNKNNCGIDLFIKSTALKVGSSFICIDCNC